MVNKKKFLIIKTSALGDILQTFPVVEYLRLKFPEAEIDWVVESRCASVVEAHPAICKVITIDTSFLRKNWFHQKSWHILKNFKKELQKKRYEVIFDLQGNIKSGVITFLAKGEKKVGFGWKSAKEKPNVFATDIGVNPPFSLPIRQKYLNVIQSYFQDQEIFTGKSTSLLLSAQEKIEEFSQKPLFMVALGSKWENKKLSLETAEAFLQHISLSYDPYFLFVWESEKEKKEAEALSLLFPKSKVLGKLSLSLWQAWMKKSDLVICVDSAALHLCATTETPSFSIFGPSLSSIYKPEQARHHSFQANCPYGARFQERCSLLRTCSTGACMKEISAEALFNAFENWYGKRVF